MTECQCAVSSSLLPYNAESFGIGSFQMKCSNQSSFDHETLSNALADDLSFYSIHTV